MIRAACAIALLILRDFIMKAPVTYKSPVDVIWNLQHDATTGWWPFAVDGHRENRLADMNDREVGDLVEQLVRCDIVKVEFLWNPSLFRYDLIEPVFDCFAREQIIIDIHMGVSALQEHDVSLLQRHCIRELSFDLAGTSADIHDRVVGIPGSFKDVFSSLFLVASRFPCLKINYIVTNNVTNVGDVMDMLSDVPGVGMVEMHILSFKPKRATASLFDVSSTKYLDLVDGATQWQRNHPGGRRCKVTDHWMRIHNRLRRGDPNFSVFIDSDGAVFADRFAPVLFGNIREDRLLTLWAKGLNICWDDERMINCLYNRY